MNKAANMYTNFCNECGWQEVTEGLPYQFCKQCGHVNIGYSICNVTLYYILDGIKLFKHLKYSEVPAYITSQSKALKVSFEVMNIIPDGRLQDYGKLYTDYKEATDAAMPFNILECEGDSE